MLLTSSVSEGHILTSAIEGNQETPKQFFALSWQGSLLETEGAVKDQVCDAVGQLLRLSDLVKGCGGNVYPKT